MTLISRLVHEWRRLTNPTYRAQLAEITEALRPLSGTHATLQGGMRLYNVHPPVLCQGYPCSVHNPSRHHMVEWRQVWREDRDLMERVCQHGVGHPDPDHVGFLRRAAGDDVANAEGVHGCDGCCRA